MRLEIHNHFNAVLFVFSLLHSRKNKQTGGLQQHACMHVERETHTYTACYTRNGTHTRTYTHLHRKAHVDQPNLTRKIQHALQLWDSYWFLVPRLIDFAFLWRSIDGDSRGFLMGLNAAVCLALSEGLSVLCALITHSCLSPADPLFGGFVQRGYRGIKTKISQRDKEPSYRRVSYKRGSWECMIWIYIINAPLSANTIEMELL